MGMVFQNSALFDSMTVCQNVGFYPHYVEKEPWRKVRTRVLRILAEVGLAEMRGRVDAFMQETDDPLLGGPLAAPPGVSSNDPDGMSPNDIRDGTHTSGYVGDWHPRVSTTSRSHPG